MILTPKQLRVLVCGGRDYADAQKVWGQLHGLRKTHGGITVIHGGAAGADSLAEQWAGHFAESIIFRADWNKHGRAAGPIRNKQMLDEGQPDLVLAFPGGRGTADMVKQARGAGVQVLIVE